MNERAKITETLPSVWDRLRAFLRSLRLRRKTVERELSFPPELDDDFREAIQRGFQSGTESAFRGKYGG